MDIHRKFTDWAIAKGVVIDGIAIHQFEGRGLGIIAKRKLEAGSQILSIPTSALLTTRSIPKDIVSQIQPCTTHGLLAAYLTLSPDPTSLPWLAVLPTPSDLKTSIPFSWAPELQSLLPTAAKTILEEQTKKIATDWTTVSTAFPSLYYEDYLYNWLVVNTRTFYYETANQKRAKRRLSRNDCMALIPFADYFNHSATATAEVSFSSSSYVILASVDVQKGQEIFISYGGHSNDFLLAEYGFILEENAWDEIVLDDYILPTMSEKQKVKLEAAGFLGKYILDGQTVCHRTQVALRLLCTSAQHWAQFVDGEDDGENSQPVVDEMLRASMNKLEKDALINSKRIVNLKHGLDVQIGTLSARWKQISMLLGAALQRIQD